MFKTDDFFNWLELLRLPFWPCMILPALLGGAFAQEQGHFSLFSFLILLVGVLLLTAASTIINEYYDVKNGIDTRDQDKPSTVLAEGRIDPEFALKFCLILILLALILFIYYAYWTQKPGVLLFAILGAAGGFFYTAPPVQLKYRGLSIPANFLILGLIIPQAVYFGLAGELFFKGLILSVPMGILTVAILWINNMRDIEADAGIITLAGLLGLKKSYNVYLILLFIPYIWALPLLIAGWLSLFGLTLYLTFPLAFWLAKEARQGVIQDQKKLSHLDVKTAGLMLTFNSLWLLSYLFAI